MFSMLFSQKLLLTIQSCILITWLWNPSGKRGKVYKKKKKKRELRSKRKKFARLIFFQFFYLLAVLRTDLMTWFKKKIYILWLSHHCWKAKCILLFYVFSHSIRSLWNHFLVGDHVLIDTCMWPPQKMFDIFSISMFWCFKLKAVNSAHWKKIIPERKAHNRLAYN